MREVVILGVGLHKFGKFPQKTVQEIAREAAFMALDDAGVQYKEIQAGFCCHVYQAMGTGVTVFEELGKTGIPITNIEVACLSSARGVALAADAISSGIYDLCLVIGVEKTVGGMVTLQGTEASYEELMGMILFPARCAFRAMRHMHDYGTTKEQYAQVSVKAHRNALLNPFAHYQTSLTIEDVLNSRLIADPITLYECSPNSDGASAVVVCSKEKAKQYTGHPVCLVAWESGTTIYVKGQPELAESATHLLAKRAYNACGIGPEDIDVVQLHDAFSPEEVFFVEDLGFCPVGEGGPFVWEGNTEIGGKIPVNTDGGLESRGHPLGATGGAMITELTRQLRGQAGPRQVANARTAVLQNAGYGGETVMIFKV